MIEEERIYIIDNQKVTIKEEIRGNRILDIGGGGEGIIGLCYGCKILIIP